MTIVLDPQQEARLVVIARARGLSAEAVVREVIERVLASETREAEHLKGTGSALVTAMQASPFKEIDLQPASERLPVRDVAL